MDGNVKEWVSKCEDTVTEMIWYEDQRSKRLKENEESQAPMDNIQSLDLCLEKGKRLV